MTVRAAVIAGLAVAVGLVIAGVNIARRYSRAPVVTLVLGPVVSPDQSVEAYKDLVNMYVRLTRL